MISLCVSKSYGSKVVFDRFSLDIREGEILCVLGESGCGKTTLLNMLAGVIPYDGRIENTPDSVGYIFQDARLLPNLTVEDNLRYTGGSAERIESILKKTELLALRHKRPKELSGGEKQRVSIARAFLSDARLLLLDEPFSSLDTGLKVRMSAVFAELWKEKKPTVLFVTHDLEEACMLGARVVVLKQGTIVCDLRLEEGTLPREYGANPEIKKQLLNFLL